MAKERAGVALGSNWLRIAWVALGACAVYGVGYLAADRWGEREGRDAGKRGAAAATLAAADPESLRSARDDGLAEGRRRARAEGGAALSQAPRLEVEVVGAGRVVREPEDPPVPSGTENLGTQRFRAELGQAGGVVQRIALRGRDRLSIRTSLETVAPGQAGSLPAR